MKTIREHLMTITDPEVRERAINNLDREEGKDYAGSKFVNFHVALKRAFIWQATGEGPLYWLNVSQNPQITHNEAADI